MTKDKELQAEWDRLTGCATALGFEDLNGLVERMADIVLVENRRPTQGHDALVEAMEILGTMADVLEGDCGCSPCVGSMAPAEDALGRARELQARLNNLPSPQPDDALVAELEALVADATEGAISTAEIHTSGGFVTCPCCDGEGEVDMDGQYTNFDGVALGVQFFGIGKHHGAHERLWTFFCKNREAILKALRSTPAADVVEGE